MCSFQELCSQSCPSYHICIDRKAFGTLAPISPVVMPLPTLLLNQAYGGGRPMVPACLLRVLET